MHRSARGTAAGTVGNRADRARTGYACSIGKRKRHPVQSNMVIARTEALAGRSLWGLRRCVLVQCRCDGCPHAGGEEGALIEIVAEGAVGGVGCRCAIVRKEHECLLVLNVP